MSLSELHHLHLVSLVCVLASLVVYVLCIVFLRTVIDVTVLTFKDIGIILGIVGISWGPIFLQK